MIDTFSAAPPWLEGPEALSSFQAKAWDEWKELGKHGWAYDLNE